ncbi:MAG: Flp pilus assembly protein CpaB [Pirellulaceae bacterium]
MRNKSLFLLLACVCGTVAALGVSQWMQANSGSGAAETIEIFVTAQAIGEQEEITADKIRLEHWPADRVPTGATADLAVLEGRFAKQMFLAGEPVLEAKLLNEKNDIVVPKGFRVVSMKADQDSGIANLVKQGERVDVDVYFTKSEMFPETKTMTILAGVKVFAIDGKTKHDPEEVRARSARTISLLIRKADHEAWMLAQRNGEVSLSIGSPGEPDTDVGEDEASEAGQMFLTWLKDHQAEQERLAAEAKARAAVTPVVEEIGPVVKPNTFRQTVLNKGNMTIYEWTEGIPVPKIIAQTGPGYPNGSELESDDASTTNTPATEKDDLDHLSGEESPFFQPGK